jgi:hypothetical protein
MASIDRIIQLHSSRRALQQARDDQRLKDNLELDQIRFEAHAQRVATTTMLRALSDACADGATAERPYTMLPRRDGHKPLATNFPTYNNPRLLNGRRIFEEL